MKNTKELLARYGLNASKSLGRISCATVMHSNP